jgi:PEGA domain
MGTRTAALAALIFAFSCAAWPQDKSGAQNDRRVLEEILTQTYQPSLVGKQMMGIGSESGVRRAGTIVVIQRPGLYASLQHTEPASSSVHGDKAELFRGRKDYEVPVGERFYVTGIQVGGETVFIGLLSARSIAVTGGNNHLWTSVAFYFPAQVLASANKETVFREIDSWFIPEGRFATDTRTVTAANSQDARPAASVSAAPAASAPVAAAVVPEQPRTTAAAPANLAIGMSRDQVLQSMGNPLREVTFENRTWMTYPVLVVVLKEGKVDSVETTSQSTGKLTIHSDPSGADIILDGQLVGSTTSTVVIPSGTHSIHVRAAGYRDWTRDLQVFAGSEINLNASLDKN